MSWDAVADFLAAVCFLLGSAFTLAAGIGVLRFPDLLSRIHAGAKPQVVGVVLALIGLGLRLRSASVIATLILVGLFQLITAPVSASFVARAGYRTGKIDPDLLAVDELTEDLARALEDDSGGDG
ncbi:MAG TPA: monovalent cation/H(+) antiporter subunit G [Acidimicrobiia bacterium]